MAFARQHGSFSLASQSDSIRGGAEIGRSEVNRGPPSAECQAVQNRFVNGDQMRSTDVASGIESIDLERVAPSAGEFA